MAYRNQEHYPDPTAGRAMATIAAEEHEEVQSRIKALMKIIRPAAEMAGLEIAQRIVFRDRLTGKEYR